MFYSFVVVVLDFGYLLLVVFNSVCVLFLNAKTPLTSRYTDR